MPKLYRRPGGDVKKSSERLGQIVGPINALQPSMTCSAVIYASAVKILENRGAEPKIEPLLRKRGLEAEK